ncbi:MAG: flippase-like domain-containing protein [Rhizobacter sp.]|nr:flippase-like domain-containing protein [Chlorobiales bacterium]
MTAKKKASPWLTVLKVAAVIVALAAFWSVFRKIDVAKTFALILQLGWLLPLIIIPYGIFIVLDTFGWQAIFPVLERRTTFFKLMLVRFATEAILFSIPAGVALAESVKLFLLKKQFGIPIPEGVAGVIARKCLHGITQSIYVVLSVVLGFMVLQANSIKLIGVPHIAWIVLVVALGMLGIFAGITLLFFSGTAAERLHRLLMKIPIESVRKAVLSREEKFHEADRFLGEVKTLPKSRFILSTALLLAAWTMESVETYFILRLLGVELGFIDVMSFEATISLLKSVFFILPAGLGVQDLGYVTSLYAFGVPDAANVGAAFVVLKRTKELFWIAVGYGLLWMMGVRSRGDAETVTQETELEKSEKLQASAGKNESQKIQAGEASREAERIK